MNCRESRQLITASVDGELSQKDAERLALHLRSCPDCSALAEREAAFVRGLRSHRSDEAMPAPLKRRLMALVQQREPVLAPPARWSWRWAPLLPALAALVLALVLWRRQAPADWTRFYLQEHASHEALAPRLQYASASPQQLSAWFQGSLRHKVHIPQMPDARLLGGRICQLEGQRIGLAVYQVDGQDLSLFIGDEKALCPQGWALPEDQVYTQSGGSLSLAAWAHGGHLHVAVAQLALPRLKSLALECQASAI
jgi:anti-sigma factor RsiW